MSVEHPLSGLMNPPENDALEQLKKKIYVADKPYQTLASRIGELSKTDEADLVRSAKIVLAFQRANVSGKGYSDVEYIGLIERLHRGLKPNLKVLLADILNEIEPVKVVAKEKAKPTAMSLYDDERFFPKRDERSSVAESIKAPLKSEA